MDLRPQDIRMANEDDDAETGAGWVCDINETPDAGGHKDSRKLKTGDTSARVIPLHPAIRAVILAAKARNAKHTRLFAKIGNPKKQDRPARVAALSGNFYWLAFKTLEIPDPEGKRSLYSLRHSVVNLTKAARWNPAELCSLIGHADTDGYGDRIACNKLVPLYSALDVLCENAPACGK